MTNSFDEKPTNNRYGFHSGQAALNSSREKAGVSIEFAHNRVIEPLNKLLRLLGQADKFSKASNTTSGIIQAGIDSLTKCTNSVVTTLSDNSPQRDNDPRQETTRAFAR